MKRINILSTKNLNCIIMGGKEMYILSRTADEIANYREIGRLAISPETGTGRSGEQS